MNNISESRICQNCKGKFIIKPEDFKFYEKIKVPAPTFCPECRLIRRMMWRNVRSLYKRNCGLCNKVLISMYGDEKGAPVYCKECWNGDKFDSFSSGKEYDFNKPFFVQLKELFDIAPRSYIYQTGNIINSDYSNFSVDNKNVYLAYSVINCEDVMYSEVTEKTKNSLDNYAVQKIEGSSYNVDCEGNYNTHYAVKSRNCFDSYFIYDCVNCSNCTLSYNLRNQQYVFKNKKLTKEKYESALLELRISTYSGFQKTKEIFDEMLVKEAIHRHAFIFASQNITGDYITHSKNIKRSFDVWDSENIAYSMRVTQSVKDSCDVLGVGRNAELIYESAVASINTYKDFFCFLLIEGCRECEYSLILKNCSNCFGCVGMTNAKFCIFNKQYSEKEYFEMIEKIKKHMDDMPYIDKKGRIFKYGESLPYDMSPFGYNETNAHDFFPIKKEEAQEKGYQWKEKEKTSYKITIDSKDLLDDIVETTDDVLKEIIGCPNNGSQDFQCSNAYRIMPNELQFYKKKNLPLPSYCPNCRH